MVPASSLAITWLLVEELQPAVAELQGHTATAGIRGDLGSIFATTRGNFVVTSKFFATTGRWAIRAILHRQDASGTGEAANEGRPTASVGWRERPAGLRVHAGKEASLFAGGGRIARREFARDLMARGKRIRRARGDRPKFWPARRRRALALLLCLKGH